MKNWRKVKIGELCEVGRGSSPRPIIDQRYFKDGTIPWIKIADASASGKYIYQTNEHVNEYGASFSRYLDEGSLIIAASGVSLGQIKFLGVKGCIHDGWLYTSNYKQDEIDKEFLYYFLIFYSEEFHNYSSGAAIQNINTDILKDTLLNLPPLPIQQRIASILSGYDDLIEVNNQRIKLLEETARELYKEWFVRMRFPGYKQAKFKKGVPEEWEIVAISDVVDFKMGQSPKSEFYNEEGIGLPFHQGVGNYGLRFPEHKVYCSVNGRIANEGDVLFSVRAPVGRLNIADRKLIIGRGLAALRHKKRLNSYLFYLLQNEFSKEDLIGNGSIFNSVGKDELKNFKIFNVGNLAKQFNNLIKPIDEQLLVLIKQNTQLRQIRDRLLPRLVSGKLKVSGSEFSELKNEQNQFKKNEQN